MIIRISGEDQYRVDEEHHARLNELDNAVCAVVDSGGESEYAEAYGALLDFVRTHGTRVGDDEIETSDLILPPSDLSFEEAHEEFTGEGLIPD